MKKLYFDNCRIPCLNSECDFLIATTINELEKNNKFICNQCSTVTAVDIEQVIKKRKKMMERLNLVFYSHNDLISHLIEKTGESENE